MNLKSAVIVGATPLGIRLSKYIEKMPWAGIKVIGFFDDKGMIDDNSKVPILGRTRQLSNYLIKNNIDYAYIALPLQKISNVISIINDCRTLGPQFYFVPDIYAFKIHKGEPQYLGDMIIYNFNPDYRGKRYFDIFFSSLIFLITFPIFILIAMLIKIDDGGPIFYGHKRITARGKVFKCWKFRTMIIDADKKLSEILRNDTKAKEEWEKYFKLKNDPRITRVGKLLRRTSLDELPQFINVLIGQMSVVGVRPVISYELSNYYKKYAGLYCAIKPGITGLWQTSKRNDIEDYNERVELDIWYIQNHSFWLDLRIIFRTILCIFQSKGTY